MKEHHLEMEKQWTTTIEPDKGSFNLNLKEVWKYRDLLMMMVKRDFVTFYKQTILGPIWFFIQPLFTTLVYTVIFGKIASISTDGLPQLLFYMSGVTIWNYFSDCFTKTSTVFKDNQNIFGKVYFPRLITPLSIVISSLVKFGVQMLLFLGFMFFFMINGAPVSPNSTLLLLPLYVLMMAGLSLGFGMIFSSLTTKYRDLTFLLQFGIQLLMYATPVIYPSSLIAEKNKLIGKVLMANPMAPIVEAFRYSFLGAGDFQWGGLLYTFLFTIFIFLLGTVIFNRTEKTFMDTV